MFELIYALSKKLTIFRKYLKKNLKKNLYKNFNHQQNIRFYLYQNKIKNFVYVSIIKN